MLGLIQNNNDGSLNRDADPALLDRLSVVTFFTTTRCNARCSTCFYWMHLNDANENVMNLEEIEKVSQTMPRFNHLLFSGGEPVLRKEIVEIAKIFHKNNGIMSIDMPNNGLLPGKAVEVLTGFMDAMPDVLVTLGLSLDGLEETHNKIRGIPNNWNKSMDTLARVGQLREERMEKWRKGEGPKPNLRIMSLTCINNQNIEEIEALAKYMFEKEEVDGMMFEALRGTPKDPDMRPPTPAQFDYMTKMSMEMNSKLYERRFPEHRALWLSYIRNVYRMQREHLTVGRLPGTCQAGINLAVIEPDGRVRMCELLDEVGDLRKEGHDFQKVWLGKKAAEQRRWIREARCSCTHCVNLGHSIDASKKMNLRRKIDEFVFRD